MKNIFFILLFTALLPLCAADENETWVGVWNYGEKDDATRVSIIAGKLFSRDYGFNYLTFRPADDWVEGCIGFEGDSYAIKGIMYNEQDKNIISFYVEINISAYRTDIGYLGEPELGKINMHFIDNDHMWLEVDYNDRNYPTTPNFPTEHFPGETVTFWRGEYLGEYKESK
jgi:hypothetical protein